MQTTVRKTLQLHPKDLPRHGCPAKTPCGRVDNLYGNTVGRSVGWTAAAAAMFFHGRRGSLTRVPNFALQHTTATATATVIDARAKHYKNNCTATTPNAQLLCIIIFYDVSLPPPPPPFSMYKRDNLNTSTYKHINIIMLLLYIRQHIA